MTPHAASASDLRLLQAILTFVAEHPDSAVAQFREAVSDWGHEWCGVTPVYLPASDMLDQSLAQATAETRELLSLFARERASLHWEQAYTRADSAVADQMLANYGYAEIIGKQGPFISTRVRAGVGVYGPRISYPLHRHAAEEIYVVLAGCAAFRVGDDEPVTYAAGKVIYHPSQMSHGLQTAQDPLVIFYVWQGGELREKPAFV